MLKKWGREFFPSLFQNLKTLIESILIVFMPHHCCLCDEKTQASDLICPECQKKIPDFTVRTVLRPAEIQGKIQSFLSGWSYTSEIQHLIEKVKFKKNQKLLKFLLSKISLRLSEKYDGIAYVPLSFSRYFERGFNQSLIIAKNMSRENHCPVLRLFKRRHSEKQSWKDRAKRLQMLNHSPFLLKKPIPDLNGKKILLVDDILTTGATLASIASLLESKGANLCAFALIHVD